MRGKTSKAKIASALVGALVVIGFPIGVTAATEIGNSVRACVNWDTKQVRYSKGWEKCPPRHAELVLGTDGLSAYDIAVKNGFEGSVDQWLASLVGADGDSSTGSRGPAGNQGEQGPRGPQGLPGRDGLDANQLRITPEQLAEGAWFEDPALPVVLDGFTQPEQLLYDGSWLWIVDSYNQELIRFDPESGETSGPFSICEQSEYFEACSFHDVQSAYGAGYIWSVSQATGELFRFDVSLQLSELVFNFFQPDEVLEIASFEFFGDSLWLSYRFSEISDDMLIRLGGLSSGFSYHELDSGDELFAQMTFDGEYVWAIDEFSMLHAYRASSESGDFATLFFGIQELDVATLFSDGFYLYIGAEWDGVYTRIRIPISEIFRQIEPFGPGPEQELLDYIEEMREVQIAVAEDFTYQEAILGQTFDGTNFFEVGVSRFESYFGDAFFALSEIDKWSMRPVAGRTAVNLGYLNWFTEQSNYLAHDILFDGRRIWIAFADSGLGQVIGFSR